MRTNLVPIGQGAITRIEVVLGVLVFGGLVVMVGPKVFARKPYAGQAAARVQMGAFSTALRVFQEDNGYFPGGSNGLKDLVSPPPGVTNWRGPYLEVVPKDPWGRDYIYVYPGTHTGVGWPYDLICLGPPDELKPIRNWEIQAMRR